MHICYAIGNAWGTLPLLTQITAAVNAFASSVDLVLYSFYMQGSNKFGSSRKASATGEKVGCVLAAVVYVMLSKALGRKC